MGMGEVVALLGGQPAGGQPAGGVSAAAEAAAAAANEARREQKRRFRKERAASLKQEAQVCVVVVLLLAVQKALCSSR